MTSLAPINNELFEDALRSYLKDNSIKVTGYRRKPAAKAGDNYTGNVYRVSVAYRTDNQQKEISVILKYITPDGGMVEALSNALSLYDKEIEMFSNTLPKIYEIIGRKDPISPNCFKTYTDPTSIVILEDLSPLGYIVYNRHLGMGLDHCLLVMKKLALLHAASFVLCEKDPSAIHILYKDGMYPDNELVRAWLGVSFKTMIETLGKMTGFEKYHAKLKRLEPSLLTKCFQSWAAVPGDFNVLNHGDLWTNNMIFSYDTNGKVKEVIFLDFQTTLYSSPAIDLHYFLATSVRDDVWMEYREYLLDYYYDQLLVTLNELKNNVNRVPSRDEFKEEYKSRAFYGLTSAAALTAVVKAPSRSDATFENLVKDDSADGFRNYCYNTEAYKATLGNLIVYYDSLGALD